jgi:hypothetical protein
MPPPLSRSRGCACCVGPCRQSASGLARRAAAQAMMLVDMCALCPRPQAPRPAQHQPTPQRTARLHTPTRSVSQHCFMPPARKRLCNTIASGPRLSIHPVARAKWPVAESQRAPARPPRRLCMPLSPSCPRLLPFAVCRVACPSHSNIDASVRAPSERCGSAMPLAADACILHSDGAAKLVQGGCASESGAPTRAHLTPHQARNPLPTSGTRQPPLRPETTPEPEPLLVIMTARSGGNQQQIGGSSPPRPLTAHTLT